MCKAVEIPVYATVGLCSANSRTASTCSRFTPGNHRRKSSTPAPSSRFSKRAFTGTRVPLNSHTPLTFPGTRSTVEHDSNRAFFEHSRSCFEEQGSELYNARLALPQVVATDRRDNSDRRRHGTGQMLMRSGQDLYHRNARSDSTVSANITKQKKDVDLQQFASTAFQRNIVN
jgi:hypothetical protein